MRKFRTLDVAMKKTAINVTADFGLQYGTKRMLTLGGEVEGSRKFRALTVTADLRSKMPILIQQIRAKFPEMSYSVARVWVSDLNEYDPTGEYAVYTPWLVRQFINENTGVLVDDVDISSARLDRWAYTLTKFDDIKKFPIIKTYLNSDIMKYKTYDELLNAIRNVTMIVPKSKVRKDAFENMNRYGKVIQSGEYTLLRCQTPEKISAFLNHCSVEAWCINEFDDAATFAPVWFVIKGKSILAVFSGMDGVVYDRQDRMSTTIEHYIVLARVLPTDMLTKMLKTQLLEGWIDGYGDVGTERRRVAERITRAIGKTLADFGLDDLSDVWMRTGSFVQYPCNASQSNRRKEPWQMTFVEFYENPDVKITVALTKSMAGTPAYEYTAKFGNLEISFVQRGQNINRASEILHKKFVEQAISAGKPVPLEVLAEYPELQVEKMIVPVQFRALDNV
jgi:hypothetical protein